MARPVSPTILRTALEEYRSSLERAKLARARDPEAPPEPVQRRGAAWLISEQAEEARHEALGSGEIDGQQAEWLQRQIHDVRYSLAVFDADTDLQQAVRQARLPSGEAADARTQLAQLACADEDRRRSSAARELEGALRPIALRGVAAHARAEQSLRIVVAPKSGEEPSQARQRHGGLIASAYSPEGLIDPVRDLPAESWLEAGAAFLDQTDAAAQDAVRYCLRGFKVGKPIAWHLLLRGLRAPELDSDSAARQRRQRSAAWLRGLGFERVLQEHLRAEVDAGGLLPVADSLLLSVPRDVRVVQVTQEYGVLSDLFAAEGVGRALGTALRFPLLPVELRWPLAASAGPAGTLGALALQLWGEPVQLQRIQQLSAAATARVSRLSGTIALLWARAWVALALTPALDAEQPQAGVEALAEQLGRALCAEMPPGVAGLLGKNRVRARARALEALAALSLHAALRERFDADWFRNPRSAELLRAACERGNDFTPEHLCEELAAPLSNAAGRAMELVT